LIVPATAPQFDRRVDLLRPVNAKDAMGGLSVTWTVDSTRWCRKDESGGRETRLAGQIRQETTAVFLFRYYPDINTSWRIQEGTRLWDIVAVKEVGRKQFTSVQAAERFGQ
jgi:SPP1 family predicted phage head-tail adaptor